MSKVKQLTGWSKNLIWSFIFLWIFTVLEQLCFNITTFSFNGFSCAKVLFSWVLAWVWSCTCFNILIEIYLTHQVFYLYILRSHLLNLRGVTWRTTYFGAELELVERAFFNISLILADPLSVPFLCNWSISALILSRAKWKNELNCFELMNCFCGMVDRRKAFSLISSRDHCQRSSPSRFSDTPRAPSKWSPSKMPCLVQMISPIFCGCSLKYKFLCRRTVFPVTVSRDYDIRYYTFHYF